MSPDQALVCRAEDQVLRRCYDALGRDEGVAFRDVAEAVGMSSDDFRHDVYERMVERKWVKRPCLGQFTRNLPRSTAPEASRFSGEEEGAPRVSNRMPVIRHSARAEQRLIGP